MQLTSENVAKTMMECLYKDEEIGADPTIPPPDAVLVHGVVSNFGFHPKRLEEHRADIESMLMQLPEPFMKSKGGGWSFLNACNDKDGNQWTGFHRKMEELFALGMAIKKVECPMPRDFWSALPGGVPYFTVLDK